MATSAEERARDRWSTATEDDPITKLGYMLLLNMIKGGLTTVRVRSDDDPPMHTRDGTDWVSSERLFAPPMKLREPLIWRLKYMADIDADDTLVLGANLRLTLSSRAPSEENVDVSFSRTARGSVIVLTRVDAPAPSPPSDDELARRAWILIDHADDATERDSALALVRQALALVPEGDGRRCDLLRRAAATCGEAGLYDHALALFDAALALTRNPRVRCHVEATIGFVHEDMHRLSEAITWYERALAIAESFPPPHLHALDSLIRLAEVAVARHDPDGAERWLARAESLAAGVFGATSAAFTRTRHARARLHRARGDAVTAEAIATEALEDATRWALVYDVDQLRYELADLALSRGDAAKAGALAREILKTPSRHPRRARAYALLARSHRAAGKEADALAALRAAGALASDALAGDHPIRLDVERQLALLGAASPYR